jgi:hypothetical protein
VINPAGTVDTTTADTIARLRAWASDNGVHWTGLIWPWRLVVTDTRYHLLVPDSGSSTGRRWHQISRLPGAFDMVPLIESLNPRTVAADSADRCMNLIFPGPRPATRGEQP